MVDFPYTAHWTETKFSFVGNSSSAGFGLSGSAINVSSNSGHWVAEASFVLHTEDQYLSWQGFIAEMRGVIGTTLVPCKPRYLPFDAQSRRMSGVDAVNFGDTSLSDTTGLGQSDLTHAELAEDAALRDGVLSVRYIDTLGLRPGHFISLGENLHRVVTAHQTDGDVYAIQIEPLLRQAFPANERVVLDRPHCRMRLSDVSQGEIGNSISVVDRPALKFIEDVA